MTSLHISSAMNNNVKTAFGEAAMLINDAKKFAGFTKMADDFGKTRNPFGQSSYFQYNPDK